MRTALHVAAFEGKEQSCTILIAFTKNFEIKDKDGFTPLHLAVFSNNYRIIRHLIMRGASRKQLTPIYSSEEIGKIMNISADVQELLRQPTCIDNFNLIRPPFEEAKNSRWTFFLNLLIFTLRFLLIVVVIYPYTTDLLVLISAAIGLFNLILLLTVSLKNPGHAQQGGDLSDLYSKYPEDKICAYCQIKKERSMKHCQQCNRCVHKFDHHCPWIHNCVGAK